MKLIRILIVVLCTISGICPLFGGTFTEVGTHPQAVLQPSSVRAKTLHTLEGWNGKLYSGFGDGVNNTGPIAVSPFDPRTRTFTHLFTQTTEMIDNFRSINGRLYSPSIDGGSDYAWGDEQGNWKEATSISMVHCFDACTLTGTDLWLVGSQGADAVAARSLDGGRTWSTAHRQIYGYRHYFIGSYNGKIYLQSSSGAPVHIFDGVNWSERKDLHIIDVDRGGKARRPQIFAGKMVFLLKWNDWNTGEKSDLDTFDGSNSNRVLADVHDFKVAYGKLYALHQDGTIRVTTNLSSWTVLTTGVPSTARSIGIVNGKLYVGTNDSKIYEYSDVLTMLPQVVVNMTQVSAYEGGAAGEFTITRYGNTSSALTVNYQLSGSAINGSDYQALSGSIVIPAGQSSVVVPVNTINDAALESNETVRIDLSPTSNYEVAEPSAAIVGLYDDDRPTVSIVASKATASEAGTIAGELTITRHGSTASPLTVYWGSGGGSAVSGVDFLKYSPTPLVIPAGSSSIKIPVTPIDDGIAEKSEIAIAKIGPSATYNIGETATATVTILDNDSGTPPPPSNAAPVVNVGADQTITLPASATLNGTVSDDGLPNGTLTRAWSKVSGPGTVTFANANAEDTTASFSTAGTYVLRLTANDGALSKIDDVAIVVNAPSTSITIAGALSGGEAHSLALKSDGMVYAWGLGRYGQLGRGNTNSSLVAVAIPNFNAVEVAAGRFHSVAVRNDGSVWSWGYNANGQLGLGTTTQTNVPSRVNGLADVQAIDAGYLYTMAVTSDGKVWTWGAGANGQLGNGSNTSAQKTPVQVVGLFGTTKTIAAGMNHALALQSDGTVWVWGQNTSGQLGIGSTNAFRNTAVKIPTLSGVVAIAAGDCFSVALKFDGTVWSWGGNGSGRLGDGSGVNRWSPVQVNISGVKEICVGLYQTLVMKNDGTIWSWGANSSGQLGNGTTTASSIPVHVNNLGSGVGLGAGLLHSLALKSDGTVWSWGENGSGQLGNNSTVDRSTAIQVSGIDLIP
jgi:alpha-tubulin suppressor-like RCC1 family protein